MLQSFLVVYATVLATTAAWFRGTNGVLRLWSLPVLSVPVLQRLVFRPVSRRFAFRALVRRRSLVTFVAFALCGAVTTMAAVLPDAMSGSVETVLARHLGPVDELIVASTPEARLEALAAVERHEAQVVLEQRTGTNAIRGAVDAQLVLSATDVTAQTASGTSAPAQALEFDMAEASRFGGDPDATGLGSVAPLLAGQVDVGADLAGDLGLVTGSVVTLKSGGFNSEFTVRNVLVARGFAAFTLDGTPNPRVLLVLPGAVSVDAAAAGARVRYLVAYSNRGPAADGWKRSRAVAGELDAALREPIRGVGAASPAASTAAYAVAVKADLRSDSRSQLDMFGVPIRLLAGLVAAAAIVCLLVLVALATRTRRGDIAALRAVGESRRDAAGAIVGELWAVLLAGCVAGATVGALLSRLCLARASMLLGSRAGAGAPLELNPTVGAICTGLAGSFAVGMAALYSANILGSRANLSEKLASRAQSLRPLLRWSGAVLGVILGLVLLWRGRSGDHLAALSGLLLLAAIVVTNASSRRSRRSQWRVRLVGVAAGGMAIAGLASLLAARSPRPGVLVASLTVLAGVVVLAAVEGHRASSNSAGATPTLADSTRIWSSFAVPVVVALTVTSCLLALSFRSAASAGGQRNANGRFGRFQLVASSLSEPGLRVVRGAAGVKELTVVRSRPGVAFGSTGSPSAVSIGTLDTTYVASRGVAHLAARAAEFASDDLAFRATLAGPSSAIVSQRVVDRLGTSGRIAVGSVVSVRDEPGSIVVSVPVTGVLADAAGFPDVIVSPEAFDRLRGDAPAAFGALLNVQGDDSPALAAVQSTGGNAESLPARSEAEAGTSSGRRLFRLLAWLALLGGFLLIAGLAVASLPERSVERSLWQRFGASDRWIVGRLVREQAWRVAFGALVGVVVAGFLARGFLRGGRAGSLGHAWFSPVAWIAVTVVAGVGALASVALPTIVWVARRPRRGSRGPS